MSGAGLLEFIIAVICLCAIVGMTFFAIPYMSKDITFQKIAKFAVGTVGLLLFIAAVSKVLFGVGAAGLMITPSALLYFAIALLVIMVVVFIINWVIAFFQVPFTEPLQFVIGAVALIALLAFAASVLFGGGIGNMRLHGSLSSYSQIG
jgi:hypothetical protein